MFISFRLSDYSGVLIEYIYNSMCTSLRVGLITNCVMPFPIDKAIYYKMY